MKTHLFGETNEEIDDVLATLLAAPEVPLGHDLISGLVGLGVYFLEQLRVPRAAGRAADGLARIVALLAGVPSGTDGGAVHPVEWIVGDTYSYVGTYDLGLETGTVHASFPRRAVCDTHGTRISAVVARLLATSSSFSTVTSDPLSGDWVWDVPQRLELTTG